MRPSQPHHRAAGQDPPAHPLRRRCHPIVLSSTVGRRLPSFADRVRSAVRCARAKRDVHSSPHEPTWSIVVSDTGIGIPPHAVNIIFEEFRQVDGGGTRAYKGSGLGLAITRNLVRMMDGQISVQSEIGKGSVFTVTLPLVTPESAKLELAESVEA